MNKLFARIYIIAIMLATLGAAACSSEEDIAGGNAPADKGGLYIHLTLPGGEAVTTRSGIVSNDERLREKNVDNLVVIIGYTAPGGEGRYQLYKLSAADFTPEGTAMLAEGGAWDKDITMNQEYEIYAIANGGSAFYNKLDGKTALTQAELKDLLSTEQTDADIFKIYSADQTGDGYTANKSFLMFGQRTWTYTEEKQTEILEVPLYKAAAKIQLNIFLKAPLINDAKDKVAPVCKTDGMYYCADNTRIDSTKVSTVHFIEGRDIVLPIDASDIGSDKTMKLTINTYSYAYALADRGTGAETPYLYVNIPIDYSSSKIKDLTDNWYKIAVMNPGTDGNKNPLVSELKRNHIYKIDATISTEGSIEQSGAQDVTPATNYSVSEWTTDEVTVDDYIYASPDTIDAAQTGTFTYTASGEVEQTGDITATWTDVKGKTQTIAGHGVTLSLKDGTATLKIADDSPLLTAAVESTVSFTLQLKDNTSVTKDLSVAFRPAFMIEAAETKKDVEYSITVKKDGSYTVKEPGVKNKIPVDDCLSPSFTLSLNRDDDKRSCASMNEAVGQISSKSDRLPTLSEMKVIATSFATKHLPAHTAYWTGQGLYDITTGTVSDSGTGYVIFIKGK